MIDIPRVTAATAKPQILYVVTCTRATCKQLRVPCRSKAEADRVVTHHNYRHRAHDFRSAVQRQQISCPCRHHDPRGGWMEPVCTYCSQHITPFDPNDDFVEGEQQGNHFCWKPLGEQSIDHQLARLARKAESVSTGG